MTSVAYVPRCLQRRVCFLAIFGWVAAFGCRLAAAAPATSETPAGEDPTLDVAVKWMPKPLENPAAEARSPAEMKPYRNTLGGDCRLDMTPIAGGTFRMGSPDKEKNRKATKYRGSKSKSSRSGWASMRSRGNNTIGGARASTSNVASPRRRRPRGTSRPMCWPSRPDRTPT